MHLTLYIAAPVRPRRAPNQVRHANLSHAFKCEIFKFSRRKGRNTLKDIRGVGHRGVFQDCSLGSSISGALYLSVNWAHGATGGIQSMKERSSRPHRVQYLRAAAGRRAERRRGRRLLWALQPPKFPLTSPFGESGRTRRGAAPCGAARIGERVMAKVLVMVALVFNERGLANRRSAD